VGKKHRREEAKRRGIPVSVCVKDSAPLWALKSYSFIRKFEEDAAAL
jgi:hypothetical protein